MVPPNGAKLHNNDRFHVVSTFEPFFLLHQSQTTDIALISVLSGFWMIAMVGKCAIFKTILSIGILTRPVNLLTFVDQAISTANRSLTLWFSVLTLLLDRPPVAALDHFLPASFCHLYAYFFYFASAYGAVGSCGLSLFRLAYLKCGNVQRLMGPGHASVWWTIGKCPGKKTPMFAVEKEMGKAFTLVELVCQLSLAKHLE